MLHRLYIRTRFSKKQIFGIVGVNLLASMLIVKPYLEELASKKRVKNIQLTENELLEKK
jgi:hypothetical protein